LIKDVDLFFYTSENRPLPLPKKVTIDFVLSKIDEYGNEISEEELKRAMIKISDRYRGSTALETSEGVIYQLRRCQEGREASRLLCNN
jgi:hypothetical protein